MQKFERKFHVLGKWEKFLAWVPFRLPLEALGRFQIQRESRGKWIGMEKAHDGSALTNSFMKGLSGLLHKEQHHVFEAWICIKQAFWTAMWDHRILKVGKGLHDLQFQPLSASSVSMGCFFPWVFYLFAHLLWDSTWIMDHHSRAWLSMFFQSMTGVGRVLGSITTTWWLSYPRVDPVHSAWGGRRNHLRYGQPTYEPPIFS